SASLGLPSSLGASPISNVTLMIGDGVLAQISNLNLAIHGLTVTASQCTLDLSTSATYKGFGVSSTGSGGLDPNNPAWEGLFIPPCSATLSGVSGGSLSFKGQNLVIDSAGLTGHLDLGATASANTGFDGFALKHMASHVDLKRGVLTDGDVSGDFTIEGAGD